MDIDISPYFDRLAEAYKKIDDDYDKVAKHYDDFSCEGCEDNCCVTVFFHYTLIENLYFMEGFEGLPEDKQKKAIQKARDYMKELVEHPFGETELSIMCPANFDGQCVAYEHRPLICRIHGLPGVLHSPRKGVQKWEGCSGFVKKHGDSVTEEMDRTVFYSDIAFIERDLREEMVFVQKLKKTIAEMIVDQTKDEITLMKKMGPEDFHKDSHII